MNKSNFMTATKNISVHYIAIFLLFAAIILVLPGIVGAQTYSTTQINIPNPTPGINSFFDLLFAIINNIVMPIATVLVVLYIIYAGFSFVTAQGKPQKIEEAKKRLLWALIGSGILLGAYGISNVVVNTVNKILQ